MDFAKKILNKYGWKDGDGLGRNNDGIAKPLKATLKFDTAGLGANVAASDFNNHWWERVFNEAASNVEVSQQTDGTVSMEIKDQEKRVEISTKGFSLKKLKKAKESSTAKRTDVCYEHFVQTATLTRSGNETEDPNKIVLDDISARQHKVLTDEELFQVCGGRTAHKGARHGLKLSGKLSRLEKQEKELLTKILKNEAKTSGGSEVEHGSIRETKDAGKQLHFQQIDEMTCGGYVSNGNLKESMKRTRKKTPGKAGVVRDNTEIEKNISTVGLGEALECEDITDFQEPIFRKVKKRMNAELRISDANLTHADSDMVLKEKHTKKARKAYTKIYSEKMHKKRKKLET